MLSLRSLINIINNNDPKIDPLGTAQYTGSGLEIFLSTQT